MVDITNKSYSYSYTNAFRVSFGQGIDMKIDILLFQEQYGMKQLFIFITHLSDEEGVVLRE